MKIIFIDETSKNENIEYLCLCGMIIDYNLINSFESEINSFKKKYEFENLKDFRKKINSKFNKNKLEITIELMEILKKYEVNIISAVILKNTLWRLKREFKNNFESKQRLFTLEFIVERFYFHIKRIYKKGMVIFDNLDNKIKNNMEKSYFNEISQQYSNIFPQLLFLKDEYSNCLQVADLIGISLNSAIHKCLEENHKILVDELPSFNSYLNVYWPLFEFNSKKETVEGWGLKVWY